MFLGQRAKVKRQGAGGGGTGPHGVRKLGRGPGLWGCRAWVLGVLDSCASDVKVRPSFPTVFPCDLYLSMARPQTKNLVAGMLLGPCLLCCCHRDVVSDQDAVDAVRASLQVGHSLGAG